LAEAAFFSFFLYARALPAPSFIFSCTGGCASLLFPAVAGVRAFACGVLFFSFFLLRRW